MDGPVVKAAVQALEREEVELILPYVHKDAEAEIRETFEKVLPLRHDGAAPRELADLYFFGAVVRLHRAGEGAPFTGLKPAGLDVGPVIPVAERAIGNESSDELVQLLTNIVRAEATKRFDRVMRLKPHAHGPVDEAREYVEAMLGLQVWAHKLAQCAAAEPHGETHEHG
jgi:hypothetical protein